jgi:hypothetical protein
MSYKVLDEYKDVVGTYQWDFEHKGKVKIFKDIVYNTKEVKVFDLEVEHNHNYIVSSKAAKNKIKGKM